MNIKVTLLFTFILAFCLPVHGQLDSVFIKGQFIQNIAGEVTIRTGIRDTSMLFANPTITIKNNEFYFAGKLLYPNTTRLIYTMGEKELYSDMFYISPGSHQWQVNIEGDKLMIQSSDPIFNEYNNGYKKIYDSFAKAKSNLKNQSKQLETPYDFPLKNKISKELKVIQSQEHQILQNMICFEPSSYIGLHELYSAVYALDEHDSLCYESYLCLDKKLKATFQGQWIAKALQCSKNLKIGGDFPDFELKDTSGSTFYFYDLSLKKYNLIEFWHSGCGECIHQIPKLQALHNKYGDKNLTILNISGDIESTQIRWKELIKEHNMTFPQYWDFNHIQASDCLIKWYPTNFLLDERGKILAKNINFDELELLLK